VTTILVVEDESSIAELIQMLLEDKGYAVVLAGNAREALECLGEAQPDLVLSDIMMPGGDGFMLCRGMRAEAGYQAIPLILMSARALSDFTMDCRFVAFLPKPFEPAALLELVDRVLSTTMPW
jgi:CheY-like chemotaxis protein